MARKPDPGIEEAIAAEAYVHKWFATYDWAVETIESVAGEFAEWPERARRVVRVRINVRGSIVKDLENEEEAYRHAAPIEDLPHWLSVLPPNIAKGGRRRVVIRIFAWDIDQENELGYDPEWVKAGDDMSAAAARARAIRWARSYTQVLKAGRASREIRMTQIEIAFWTTGPRSRLL